MSFNRLNSQVIQGRFESSTQGVCVGSTGHMPEPVERLYGVVLYYIGQDTAEFIQNHIYMCVLDDDVYRWEDVSPIVELEYDREVALGTDSDGHITSTSITVEELERLDGIRDNIQAQIDGNYEVLDSKIDDVKAELDEKIDGKVDKYTDPEGNVYGLSQADFTIREKQKLSTIAVGAQVNNIEEIQVNNVTVQPREKIVNLSILEGHTYPIPSLVAGQGFEVKHNLIRTVYFAQVRDSEGNVIQGSMKVNDTVAVIVPDVSATDCTMFIICGGI